MTYRLSNSRKSHFATEPTGCRGFFLEPVATSHRQYEARRGLRIEGRRLQDIAQQFGSRETSVALDGLPVSCPTARWRGPPFFGQPSLGGPLGGSLTSQHQPSQRRQSSPMLAR